MNKIVGKINYTMFQSIPMHDDSKNKSSLYSETYVMR